jgi:hypothetical protein
MESDNKPFTLIAMIFAIIFYIQLHKEISLNSSNDVGLSDFGMRAMKVV